MQGISHTNEVVHRQRETNARLTAKSAFRCIVEPFGQYVFESMCVFWLCRVGMVIYGRTGESTSIPIGIHPL